MDFISLFDLNNQVKRTLKDRFTEPVWITAEITSIQENRSGHCYLELADKPEGAENPVAVAKGTVWAFTYRLLKPYFETTTGRNLERGMKVLIQVEVVFHELYGFSLNIKDIDPTFTIGDLERKKREILEQLEKDGVIDMNCSLKLHLLPKNIAVISSPTAAGLGDFMNQLQHNSYGYKFHIKLFPAVMQGEKTADSVISALDRIYEYESLFDVVVLIRGGGAQSDLGCFDSYELASNVAQFPLPVVAGIGHERDETIVDRVAFKRVKTPTAAAAFLIEKFQEFDARLEKLKGEFVGGVQELVDRENIRQQLLVVNFKRWVTSRMETDKNRLRLLSHRLEHAAELFWYSRRGYFDTVQNRLRNRLRLAWNQCENSLQGYAVNVRRQCEIRLERDRHLLELADTKVRYVDPRKVLERGYSITRLNGKAVRSLTEVKDGDVLETFVADGKLTSVVKGNV